MDIRMPVFDGLEATRRILASGPAARVLVLTTLDLDEYVFEALRAGASGFVVKDDPPEQLLAAIRGGSAKRRSGRTSRTSSPSSAWGPGTGRGPRARDRLFDSGAMGG
jgi:DNA-binding NarL/FixJ family response regulator